MKIVHHHANGRFNWLISGQQSVNPSREAISILSGKYKIFTFVHPVDSFKTYSISNQDLFNVHSRFVQCSFKIYSRFFQYSFTIYGALI